MSQLSSSFDFATWRFLLLTTTAIVVALMKMVVQMMSEQTKIILGLAPSSIPVLGPCSSRSLGPVSGSVVAVVVVIGGILCTPAVSIQSRCQDYGVITYHDKQKR